MTGFSDPGAVASYRQRTAQLVPGLHDLHRMSGVLLAERVSGDARILVLGAGGGMELGMLSRMQPGWRFVGVDPSGPMLDLARSNLGAAAARVAFHEGYVDTAPEGPFDAAVCLLTLHFLPAPERLATLRALAGRLRPGAPFVCAHYSFPAEGAAPDRWLGRAAGFAAASGVPAPQAAGIVARLRQLLPVLSPAQDEALLEDAGFADVELFYAALAFRGWIGIRSGPSVAARAALPR
ncbi:class I SAM-dependent methyltransferase [Hoeflea olei]|uniref:Methyltransferase n=1 Tax=Hoeflea olei TaxID=1480615 RepID=A0A1C1YYR9_9HYPH|nr:class I SAM-dependent methyltransferase [Hoeflea olei]OCW58560.1 methyltransferase [Hoeflea olei]